MATIKGVLYYFPTKQKAGIELADADQYFASYA